MAKFSKFNVALCDSLQSEYCKYKHNESYDRYLINRILRFSEGSIITNVEQLKRINRTDELQSQEKKLRSAGLKGQTDLADLAKRTLYNIVLSDTCNDFPYVNILDDTEPIQPLIGGCFFRSQPRDKAVKHISCLCEKASEILIYDKYLSFEDNMERNIDTLSILLPDKKIKLIHHTDHLTHEAKQRLKDIRTKLILQPEELPTHHDRYIVIDKGIEIILTSGFYNLASQSKEITYIVRRCTASRFE